MTPDQIDTAIAEFLGWTDIESCPESYRLWGNRPGSDGQSYRLNAVPRFHRCLNAMHEAETGLTEHESYIYDDQLANLFTDGFLRARYTAIQRAEALLRAISRWQEPEKLSTHCAV